MKIYTENVPGNTHAAAHYVNKRGWAEYLLQMETSGNYTICVFRMPTERVNAVRLERGWVGSTPVDFDDPPRRRES